MRSPAESFRHRHECARDRIENSRSWKVLGPEASPGGEGGRFRAYVLDSESGGAKGHYPNIKTRLVESGSRAAPKKFRGKLGNGRQGRPVIAIDAS